MFRLNAFRGWKPGSGNISEIGCSVNNRVDQPGGLPGSPGSRVSRHGGGISGLHLTTHNTYDVIIVDLVLPGLDGVSLCKCLREEAGKLTPILMLTARDSLRAHLHVFATRLTSRSTSRCFKLCVALAGGSPTRTQMCRRHSLRFPVAATFSRAGRFSRPNPNSS